MQRVVFSTLVGFLLLAGQPVLAQQPGSAAPHRPSAEMFDALPLGDVELLVVPGVDPAAMVAEDLEREAAGLPPRYALARPVQVSPRTHGTYESLDAKTLLWRLRVRAPGAVSLNLGFTRYAMPVGGQLMVHSADGRQVVRPFTDLDNASHGQLWTPVVRSDEIVIELTLPLVLLSDLQLLLTQVGVGYRGFGTKDPLGAGDSGSCNVDVVCPDGDGWRAEIPAVGVISLGGSFFCTGFMVNNTSNDRTPYFMTANHCGVGSSSAPSLVVYWNYETSVCTGPPDGQLTDFNTGSIYRASYGPSDMTLVQLDQDPDPAHEITFAGWDRSGADEPGAVAIHHPATDEKRVSFEFQPTATSSYLGSSSPGDGTHVWIKDWDIGTTEPGSSGSPVFNLDHQVIGQLHGGWAACGNDLADYYGKFSLSWDGGGTPATRLKDWLDAANTGAVSTNTLGGGLLVTPSGTVVHEGPVGGPFTNPSVTYTLLNQSDTAIAYAVTLTHDVGVLIDGGTAPVAGTLPPLGGTTQVLATLDASVNSLGAGVYDEQIQFADLTNGLASMRIHSIEVGRVTVFSFDMEADPGWTMVGGWEHGKPRGAGGDHGNVDPTTGATGPNVLGYNLLGDYPNNMGVENLTSAALDCSGLSGVKVRFQRWLNVEQPLYDHASFQVSNDGTNFVTVWENGGEVTDAAWSLQEHDISAVADHQASVTLRWSLGPTDGSWQYSGWNVDDVEVSAVVPSAFLNYGAALAGSGGFEPALTGSGDTSPGGTFNIDLAGGLGGASGQLALGFSRASIPFKGGLFLVGAPVTWIPIQLAGAPGVPGAGSFGVSGSFSDPALSGTTFELQALIADGGAPKGVALSEGLEVFIGF